MGRGSECGIRETKKNDIRDFVIQRYLDGEFRHKSNLPVKSQLVEVVSNGVLILQEPVDRRLVAHRFFDYFRSCLAVHFEQTFMIYFPLRNRQDTRVEPDGIDDAEVIHFLLGNIPGTNRIKDAMRDASLHRAHEN